MTCPYRLRECEKSCVVIWLLRPFYEYCKVYKEIRGNKGLEALGYEEEKKELAL